MRGTLVKIIIFLFPFLQIVTIIYVQRSFVDRALPGRMFDPTFGQELYISTIRQGMQGHWSTDIAYINTPIHRVFGYHLLFILLGQINRVLQIEPVLYYQILQIIFGICFLFVTFIILQKLLPKTQALLAYFFVTGIETGIYFPSLQQPITQWVASFPLQHMLFERHFGFIHHSFGKTLGIIFFLSFLKYMQSRKTIYLCFTLLSMIVLSDVLPSFSLVLLICFVIPYTLITAFDKKLSSIILPALLSFGAFIIPSFLLKKEFDQIPILAVYSQREKMWWSTTEALTRYASSLLLYYPLILISLLTICLFWKKLPHFSKRIVLVMLAWLILPALLIPISSLSLFPVSGIRLVDGTQYFPAGIFISIGVYTLLKHLSFNIQKISISFIALFTVIASLSMSVLLVKNYIGNTPADFINIYPNSEFWQAVNFFQKVPEESGVLMNPQFGEVLPGYASVRMYIAASGATWPYYDERLTKLVTFYKGELSTEEAAAFIKNNSIDYIYYGVQERSVTTKTKLYPEILESVYHTNLDDIYQLKK